MMDQDEPNHPLEDRLSVLTVKDPPSLMQTCQRSYYGLAMSQGSENSELIAELQATVIELYIIYSLAALVVYEHIITFQQEVQAVWKRKWSAVTWLFALNRYLLLLVSIGNCLPTTEKSCGPSLRFWDFIVLVQFIVSGLVSALRVFALWNRNAWLFSLIFSLGLVPVVINIYYYIRTTIQYETDPMFGTFCAQVNGLTPRVTFQLSLSTSLAMTIADVLVLIFTWARTFKDYRNGYRLKLGMPLSRVLLRDGTIYFITLFVVNLLQMLIENIPSLQAISPASFFVATFTPLLISRFLLNLRQVGDPGDSGTDWSDMTDLSTPQFRVPTFSILTGNLAMPLDYTTDDSSITLGDDCHRRRSRIPGSVAESGGCEEVAELHSDGIQEEKVVMHQ